MKTSEQVNEIFSALAKAQSSMKDAKMDKENPHFRSKYASLSSVYDAVRACLTSQGICVTQHCEAEAAGGVTVTTMLGHSSGQWIVSSLTLPLDKITAQGMGSAISYGRRYALASIAGIASDEDDDGNHAETMAPAQRPQSRPQQSPVVAAAHNPNAVFIFPAGKYKGQDMATMPASDLRGWYEYFSKPGTEAKGWIREGLAAAAKILNKIEPAEAAVPGNQAELAHLDEIPF